MFKWVFGFWAIIYYFVPTNLQERIGKGDICKATNRASEF